MAKRKQAVGTARPARAADQQGQHPERSPQSTRRRPPNSPDAILQAARFGRVRADHAAELAEDYVELIAQLIEETGEARTVDIARRLGVSHVTVTKTLARLRREGLVHSEPYRSIFLTPAGRKLAARAAARHALLVQFLRTLGVNRSDAEADAEGIEHHLSDATIRAIKRFLKRTGQ